MTTCGRGRSALVYARPVLTAKSSDVIERIAREAEEDPGGAVAFDGDGTLWAGDVGEDFFAALVDGGLVTDVAGSAMSHEAALEGLDASGTPVVIARRIHEAYIAGKFPEERICEIMTWAGAGHTVAEIDAFAEALIHKLDLGTRLHREAHRVLGWAKERGIPVYLVSASPRPIVEAAARFVGIDVTHVASATELASADGVIAPEVMRPIPYGPGKVARLREKLTVKTLYAAFGDNAFDVQLLLEARIPVAIRPKQRLVDRAGEVPGLVVLERE